MIGVDRKLRADDAIAVRPGAGDDMKETVAGLVQRNRHGREAAAKDRRFAHHVVQFVPGTCAHDGFIGRAQRREHVRQALPRLLDLAPRLVARKDVHTERHVLGDALHQSHDFVVDRTEFAMEVEHDQPTGLTLRAQRQRGARRDAGLARHPPPQLGSGIIADVVGDQRALLMERRSVQATPGRLGGIDRKVRPFGEPERA